LEQRQGYKATVVTSNQATSSLRPSAVRTPRRPRQAATRDDLAQAALVDFRVVEVGLVDARLQFVRHQPAQDAAEVAEDRDVRFGPGALVEVKDGANKHVPGARQHHHENPDPVPFADARVDPLSQEAVVDPGLLARFDVLAQDGDLRLLAQSRFP
jgi:hypothetical protein